MWPPATSTTIPSGSFRPSSTMVFKSEPSGFDVMMRPVARSIKNKRLEPDFAEGFSAFVFEIADDIEFLPFPLFRFTLQILQDLFIEAHASPSSSNEPDIAFHRPND